MNRTWKQVSFGALYLLILVILAAGIYFLYLKPAPSCTDNKQNEEETGVDCGGSCIPCEVKGLTLTTGEVKSFAAGEGQTTLLSKVTNPSQNFTAVFSYEFKVDGVSISDRQLKGKAVLGPGESEYIVLPALTAPLKDIKNLGFEVTALDWRETKSPRPNASVLVRTDINQAKVIVSGSFANKSAGQFPAVALTAILFDSDDNILNASITRLENVEAFSQKSFTVFFPEVEGLVQSIDPTKTIVEWNIDDKELP